MFCLFNCVFVEIGEWLYICGELSLRIPCSEGDLSTTECVIDLRTVFLCVCLIFLYILCISASSSSTSKTAVTT